MEVQMKEIKTENLRDGVRNFIESFRDKNNDVTRYGSEKIVDGMVDKNRKGYSSTKISDRKITTKGVM